MLTRRCGGAWQGDGGLQPVLRQVWATASRAVDGLVDVAEDYVPENVSRGTVRRRRASPPAVPGAVSCRSPQTCLLPLFYAVTRCCNAEVKPGLCHGGQVLDSCKVFKNIHSHTVSALQSLRP